MSKIHTTIGIYSNGEVVVNGVESDLLDAHIKYNLTMRPNRAFVVDGSIMNQGSLEIWEIMKYKDGIKKQTCDTRPYK